MRFVLFVCAALLLGNFILFMWPGSISNTSQVFPQRADYNAHFLSLNKELEEKYFEKERVVVPQLDELSEVKVTYLSCYRLGPFMDKANYQAARTVLLGEEVEYTESTRASQNTQVYRVYLGGYTA